MFDADKTRIIGLPYGEKNYDNMLSRFHPIPECNGQTDGQIDVLYQYRVSVCRGGSSLATPPIRPNMLQILSRISTLTRDIDIAILSVCPSHAGMAALFYSPIDFTDAASDLHQTSVKFIGESIDSTGVDDRCTKLLPITTIHSVKQRLSEQQSYDMPMYNK